MERRRSTVGLAIGLAVLTAWIVSIYPIIRDSDAFVSFLDNFPPAMASLFGLDPATYLTGAGYLGSQMYSLFAPIALIAFAVEGAIQATARDEQDDTIDVLMSLPISRTQALLSRLGATAVSSFIVSATLAGVVLLANPILDLKLSVVGVTAVSVAMWLMALVFGTLAALMGAFSGQGALARGVGLGLAFVSWLITGFAPLYDWLAGPSAVSPFTWFDSGASLLDGFGTGHVWLLIVPIVVAAATVRVYSRRDLGTERLALPELPTVRFGKGKVHTSIRSPWILNSVFGKTIWDRRKSIWAWIGAVAAMLLITFAAWPAFSQDADALEQLISALPQEVFALFGMGDPALLARAPGFISSRAFQSVGPILSVALGITIVSAMVIKEEASGRLDMVLANPVTRRHVIREKALGISALFGIMAVALTIVTFVGNAAYGTELDSVNTVAANLGLALLGLAFAGITIAIWARTGSDASPGRWAAGIAGFTWFLNGLGSIVEGLRPFRPLSPFYWYMGDVAPLGKGFEPLYLLLLLIAGAGAFVAIRNVNGRDLAV